MKILSEGDDEVEIQESLDDDIGDLELMDDELVENGIDEEEQEKLNNGFIVED